MPPSPLPDDVYAVVLAGGSGTRFWPKSRHLRPKQLCKLGDSDVTMLEATLARLDGFIAPERRIIVTHAEQAEATRRIVGSRCALVLAEPEARNTANALALACLHLGAASPAGVQPVMISLHADHLVEDVPALKRALADAVQIARTGQLALVGIVPSYPETGYGYIERGEPLPTPLAGHRVARFREKPDLATARQFLERGGFFWNAGIFVWRVDVLIEELRQTLAVTVDTLAALTAPRTGLAGVSPARLAEAYARLPKISIDHAVLEVSRRVAVVEADIGWQDVGSWDALERAFPTDADGNLAVGDALLIEAKGTTVDTDGPFIAALGVQDLVIVSSGGAILVCPKSRAQDVKTIVEKLKDRGRNDLI
jgi:mannose-1-phosphate guanylyltransferase/mannose-6-phosphate isomerase